MDKWVNKVAIVTGAYSGIGGAISAALVEHNMTVVGCGRNMDRLKEFAVQVKGPGNFTPIACDVSKEEDVLAMFKTVNGLFGGVDVFINNAGLNHVNTILTGDTDKWKEILEVNLLAVGICSREAVKSMKGKGVVDGYIVNIGSRAAHRLTPNFPQQYMYAASKHGARALTEGLRNELQDNDTKIRVTHISPGLVNTELQPRMWGPEIAQKKFSQRRSLQPQDIADAVVYVLGTPPHVQVTELTIVPK